MMDLLIYASTAFAYPFMTVTMYSTDDCYFICITGHSVFIACRPCRLHYVWSFDFLTL